MDGYHDNRVGRTPYFHPVDETDCSATPAFEKVDCFESEGEDCIQNLHRQVPSIEDAAALVMRWWEAARDAGHGDIGTDPPDYETVRRRIRRNETFENYERRHGRHAAIAKFSPKGESIIPSRPFETVFMDGTEFEHYTLYSDAWKEVAGKMKGVAAMDAFSLYKWPPVGTSGGSRDSSRKRPWERSREAPSSWNRSISATRPETMPSPTGGSIEIRFRKPACDQELRSPFLGKFEPTRPPESQIRH